MRFDPIEIDALRTIADRFDYVLLDQWGTLHEGNAVFPAARDCVTRLKAAGKRILVLSNSGKRSASNEERLRRLGLPRAAYDGVLTSGEITWAGLRERAGAPFADLGRSCFLITRGGDHSIIDGLDLTVAAEIDRADFILLGGLDDDVASPEHWRACLTAAAERRLPMLCANPDLIMFSANELIPAPGALARFYETLGGPVAFVGKPHAPIFDAALNRLQRPDPARVLMIGDSLDHDVAGARRAGMLTVLLSTGVHRQSLQDSSRGSITLRKLTGADISMPHWIMKTLTW